MTTSNGEASGLEFLKRLRYRWPFALGVFGVLFLLVLIGVFSMPNKYESRLKIVVKNDRIDPFVGSDKQTQSILNVNDVSEPRINTEIQLLTSSKVLIEVVRACHLDELAGGKNQTQVVREQMALRQLQGELVVVPVRNSNVIEVSYASTDAERSTQVVNAVWQSYNLANRKMHAVPGSLSFFEKLALQYDHQLSQAQAELTRFRTRHNIVSLPEEQSLALANAARLRSQIADSTAEQQRSSASAERLKQEMDTLPAKVERDRRSIPNQALTQQLTSLLVTLQNKRTELAQRYQPGDRLLKELDAEIARTESALAQAGGSPAAEVSVAANPAMDVAQSEYLRMSAIGAGATAQASALARQLGRDNANLSALTADSASYQQLIQKVSELQELDLSYHKKVDEARFEQLLDQQQISNLAIVDEPFTSALPTSPKRGLLIVLGFLWSALVSLIAAAVAEVLAARGIRFDRSPFGAAPASGTYQPAPRTAAAAMSSLSTSPLAQAGPMHRAPTRSSSRVPESNPLGSQLPSAEIQNESSDLVTKEVEPAAKDRNATAANAKVAQEPLLADERTEMLVPSLLSPQPAATALVRSPLEINQSTGLPLLATVSAASLAFESDSAPILYLSVQRTEPARRRTVRR